MIHTFTKDLFIREKVWSKMNDYERVLLKLIAKEICMQPTLIRFFLNDYFIVLIFESYHSQRTAYISLERSSCDTNLPNL